MTGEKGLPVAISARPSLQSQQRRPAMASDWVVGLDSGRMTGRSTCAAIALHHVLANTPGWPEAPIECSASASARSASRSRGCLARVRGAPPIPPATQRAV